MSTSINNLTLGSAPLVSVPTENQLIAKSTVHAERLPTVSECTIHLQLLDAFVHLKEAVDHHGREEGLVGSEAWDLFCRTAAARFLEWSQTVDSDASGVALPTPPLDVLLVWHAFMLNPSAYKRYANEVLQGRLGGKGIDWDDLKTKLDTDYKNADAHLATLRAGAQGPPTPEQRTAAATMTPDGFDMAAAVQRQLLFSQAMHAARWLDLDPPALLPALLSAALARYDQFFTLVAENPGVGVAPARDVDLAWHTHQLSPRRYAAWCRARAGGRFVDHRDDLAADVLARSADDAARLYRARFGTAYKVCLCRGCVGARFGGEEACADGSDADEDEDADGVDCARQCPSTNCQTNCQTACKTACNAPKCQTQCGTKCGYVCGACDAK